MGFDFYWPLNEHVFVPWEVGRICSLSTQKGWVCLRAVIRIFCEESLLGSFILHVVIPLLTFISNPIIL